MQIISGKSILLLFLSVICLQQGKAIDSTKTVHATILLPLYLDSAFQYSSYQFGNTLPRFLLPGLEFYHGVQLAADSLREEGIDAKIEVIDTRKERGVESVFAPAAATPSLVISMVQSGSELKAVSSAALTKNIPFISATYPNDGGVTSNPNLVIMNSTLKSHCFALYKYLQKNYRNSNLLVFTRKGNTDDRIKNYLKEAEKATPGDRLRWKMISLSEDFNDFDLSVYLDSNKTNTIVGATLDSDFASKLISTLSSVRETYTCNIFGMPTWDELPLDKAAFKGIDVYYSTPFISFSGNAAAFNSINKKFKKLVNNRPGDMVFKGFEITYRYIKTMFYHPNDFMVHINDPRYRMFADFKIEPTPSQNPGEIDYWENRKLYFVKKTDGAIKGVY